jgi:hypothetical protein
VEFALNQLITTDAERAMITADIVAIPTKAPAWEKITPGVDDLWFAAAWAYAMNQHRVSVNNATFADDHIIFWHDIGTDRFYRLMKGSNPLLIHMGLGLWGVFDTPTSQHTSLFADVFDAMRHMHTVLAGKDIRVEPFDTFPS